MREELLVREIARKRMVEDEILRELEYERSLSARGFEEDRFLPLERGERFGLGVGEGLGPGLMQRSLKIGEYERSPSLPVVRGRNVETDEWPAPWERAAGEFEKPTVLPKVSGSKNVSIFLLCLLWLILSLISVFSWMLDCRRLSVFFAILWIKSVEDFDCLLTYA